MVSRAISTKYLFCFFTLLFLLLSFQCMPLQAQVAGATLSGVISDASGAGIPNAGISIKNLTTGVIREVKTDGDGYYTAPNLLPGGYEITVTANGFATVVQKGITLAVGATPVLNLSMRVGQISERVEVSAAPPNVELGSSTISGNIDSNTVRELPLNGRDWTPRATLQGGGDTVPVQQPNQGTAPKGNRGYGNQMTISGT